MSEQRQARPSNSTELDSISDLPSVDAMREALARLAGQFGKVGSVIPLTAAPETDPGSHGFLVNFEAVLGAMAAARHWGCAQFGSTSVLVSFQGKAPAGARDHRPAD